MNDNEKTETENAINRKLDALKAAIEELMLHEIGAYPSIEWAAMGVLNKAWKEQEEDEPLC